MNRNNDSNCFYLISFYPSHLISSHLISFVGKFWLANSKNVPSGPQDLQIQIAMDARPYSPTASVVGVAFRVMNFQVVIRLDFVSQSDSVLIVNNQTISTLNPVVLGDDSDITIIKEYKGSARKNRHKYEINVPYLFSMRIDARPDQHSSTVSLKIAQDAYINNNMEGVCGNLNNNRNDDSSTTVKNTWPVGPGESLFVPDDYVFTPVNPSFSCNVDTVLPADLAALAHQVCETSGIVSADFSEGCLFDVCVTGDITAAYPCKYLFNSPSYPILSNLIYLSYLPIY